MLNTTEWFSHSSLKLSCIGLCIVGVNNLRSQSSPAYNTHNECGWTFIWINLSIEDFAGILKKRLKFGSLYQQQFQPHKWLHLEKKQQQMISNYYQSRNILAFPAHFLTYFSLNPLVCHWSNKPFIEEPPNWYTYELVVMWQMELTLLKLQSRHLKYVIRMKRKNRGFGACLNFRKCTLLEQNWSRVQKCRLDLSSHVLEWLMAAFIYFSTIVMYLLINSP